MNEIFQYSINNPESASVLICFMILVYGLYTFTVWMVKDSNKDSNNLLSPLIYAGLTMMIFNIAITLSNKFVYKEMILSQGFWLTVFAIVDVIILVVSFLGLFYLLTCLVINTEESTK